MGRREKKEGDPVLGKGGEGKGKGSEGEERSFVSLALGRWTPLSSFCNTSEKKISITS